MSPRPRIHVIAAGSSKAYKEANQIDGCTVLARGWTEEHLRAALSALATDADLIILGGHGSINSGPHFLASDREYAKWVPFTPCGVSPPQLLLDMCHGGSRPFADAVHRANKNVEVFGPRTEVTNGESRQLIPDIIRRFAGGADLRSALRDAKAQSEYQNSDLWQVTYRSNGKVRTDRL